MTPEEAYCYLNCANLPPCSAAAGDCTACCKDCPKDYSNFSDTAYYKDGVFYKNFISDNSSFRQEEWSDTIDYKVGSANIKSTYKSKNNECLVYGSNISQSDFDDGDSTFTNSIYNGTKGYGCGCDTNDVCFVGARCIDPNGDADLCCGIFTTSCGTCADDTCETFDSGCIGLECVCNDDGCYGFYSEVNTAKISFVDEVQLYDSKGEEVDPSFIGASYDPCAPCATWSAACHFFAVVSIG